MRGDISGRGRRGLLENRTPDLRRIATRVDALALADDGQGQPVVCWPSLFSDHRLFAQVVPLLTGDWRVLRIDGPGFGQSDPPRGDVQPQTYTDAVIDVLDALGLERAFVVGCTWGGHIAVHAGVRAPSRVCGVLATNTPLGPSRGAHAFELLGTRWIGASRFWGRGIARSMFSAHRNFKRPRKARRPGRGLPGRDICGSKIVQRCPFGPPRDSAGGSSGLDLRPRSQG